MRVWTRSAAAICGPILLVVLSTQIASAQRGDRGRGSMPMGGDLGMLMREDVRKELEIVDDQMEQLREIGNEMREEMREMFSGFRDLSQEERQERFAEMREKFEQRREDLRSRVNDILLPHQRDRLKQIVLQSQLRRSGTAGVLAERMADELNITDQQKEKLKEVQQQVQKELQDAIREARNEARDKILEVLDPEQREKFKSLLGDEFEADESRRGFFGGGRGGQGGPSGRPRRPAPDRT